MISIEHPDPGIGKFTKNLGNSKNALSTWARHMNPTKAMSQP